MGSERLEAGVETRGFAGAGRGRDGIGFCPGRADELFEDGLGLARRPRNSSACFRTWEKSYRATT